MLGSCSTNQENWTMLAVLFVGMVGCLLMKWRIGNSAKPVSFIAFLKQVLSG